jgi:hypothetical protein
MTITEYAATTARAFVIAEIAMASVNCRAANVTRAQAEKLLEDYFARVERSLGPRIIPSTAGPDRSTTPRKRRLQASGRRFGAVLQSPRTSMRSRWNW